jgi:Cu(I)/Ag(I) efflux system membrane fusion protein
MHFNGQVDYLYPELAQSTRSLKVRVVVKNPELKLRPGMFASAHFRGATVENVLTVPSEAVIKTGSRSVVIVADDGTHFRPVVVRVGAEHGDRSEILDGLTVGQSVVASGQFLIDSEASLRSAFESLGAASGTAEMKVKPELMPSPANGRR